MIGTKRIPWIKLLIAVFLIVGLPIFIWAVATQRIELRKRAATTTAEICWNRVTEFDGKLNWPDGCKGNPNAQGCAAVLVPLTEEELTGYNAWISNGKPFIPNCSMATPTPGTNVCSGKTEGSACTDTCARACPPDVKVCTDQCTTRSGFCISGKCETWITPTPGTNVCSGKTEGSACTDTCAPACPPGTPNCIDKCTTRGGVCISGRCETWLTPTPTRYPTPSYYPTPSGVSCSPNGSSCTFTTFSCPTSPAGTSYPLSEVLSVLAQPGICQNYRCIPISPSPTRYPTPSYYMTPTPTRPPYPTVSQYLTPTPTPTPILLPRIMTFRVKLMGVNGAEAQGATITVKLKLKNGTVLQLDKPLVLNPLGNGVYTATATVTNPLPAPTEYRVLIKGEKHSQIVFCRPSGQTEPCNDTEYIATQSDTFDFTGRPLPPGDLNHDGKVNTDDIKLITDLFNKPSSQQTPQDLLTADVNYSGKVDSLDLSLVFQTLETRYDEN